MSVSITAKNKNMTCSNVKNDGLNSPFRAISIIPLENIEPSTTPALATNNMVRRGATFEPIAELRKLTASLLTPTIRSIMATTKRMTSNTVKKSINR